MATAQVQQLVAACLDHIALEGRRGATLVSVMNAISPPIDDHMSRFLWCHLRRLQASGLLSFHYAPLHAHTRATMHAAKASHSTAMDAMTQTPPPAAAKATLKRKRPESAAKTETDPLIPHSAHLKRQRGRRDDIDSTVDMKPSDQATNSEDAANEAAAVAEAAMRVAPTLSPQPVEAIANMSLEDALAPRLSGDGSTAPPMVVTVLACEALRHRALNVSLKAIMADLVDEHYAILEEVGRSRKAGITIQELQETIADATIKKLHTTLDTLLSYNLVVKRMLIVTRPVVRRMNIVHLPRFAGDFTPEMYDESAEFESDEHCKKILCASVEHYLKELPSRSAVMYDLGRELGLQKRHLEVLRSHIMQESKRDGNFHLELFQAVLKSTSKSNKTLEPKILNCIRYKPPPAAAAGEKPAARGMACEVGLLSQMYDIIKDTGTRGATVVELRNHLTLPGNKLPYKLVSMLAGRYGLRAETIILGKNKAFRLYVPQSDGAACGRQNLVTQSEERKDSSVPTLVKTTTSSPCSGKKRPRPTFDTGESSAMLAPRSKALGLKLHGSELEGTRTRRKAHIMDRLEKEKIISISSLRASVLTMEREEAAAAVEAATEAGDESAKQAARASVGVVDKRSINRLVEDLESEGLLRLLQVPLPARNVSTKFRALRCVMWPGYENDEAFIEAYVKNYSKDERVRRIQQNAEQTNYIHLKRAESDDEADARNEDTAADQSNESATTSKALTSEADDLHGQVVNYRIARFSSQSKTGEHHLQYRRLGFAYGVMFRCKVFHRFLWHFLHHQQGLGLSNDDQNVFIEEDEGEEGVTDDKVSRQSRNHAKGFVFSRENVLHSMPVSLYIQAFSGGKILTPSEEGIVQEAIAGDASFEDLPDEIRKKIWSHESQRTAKVLGTLTDLGLICPYKIGMKNLIKILRTGYTDGKDGVLSRALKDNALGGLFCMRNELRIQLDDTEEDERDGRYFPPGQSENGAQKPRKRVNELNEIRILGTTEKTYSFGSMLPLVHKLQTTEDVDRFWETLECLCLEQMVMEVSNPRRNEPAVCEIPKPVKTRARRMFRILAWIPKTQRVQAKAKSNNTSSVPTTKRSGIVSRRPRARKIRLVKNKGDKSSIKSKCDDVSSDLPADNDPDHGEEKPYAWTEEQQSKLLTYFIENCESRWRIVIPQGLQRPSETTAFRTPSLSRSGFGLMTIARKLGKRNIDVKKRLKEMLTEPQTKLQFEKAKQAAIALYNPSGVFDEQEAIRQSCRLTALFRRAVMMIVSPKDEYHPLVAEELISFWTASEIRCVWRYLWLRNWIVRATERDKIRGYITSQRLQDTLKLTTLSFPLMLFQQAAELESMVHSSLEEVMGNGKNRLSFIQQPQSLLQQTDHVHEEEFPINATPGHCALQLSCQVMGTCVFAAVHTPIPTGEGLNIDVEESEAQPVNKKRKIGFLHDRSLKAGSGFAAHLAKHINVAKLSLVTESWQVETRMHATTVDDKEQLRQLEAFSLEPEDIDESADTTFHPYHRQRGGKRIRLENAIIDVVKSSGMEGLTISATIEAVKVSNTTSVRDWSDSRARACVNMLVDEGVVLCVNAYDEQRLVSREFGDLWLLRPFSLVNNENDQKPMAKVVFEGEKDTLSFPWLKMDGATNYKFLFSIQRKLLSYVLLAPGITEESAFEKMDGLLTLQDTREALALLVEEGLVYTRLATKTPVSLFGNNSSRCSARVLNPVGNILACDRTRFMVHYFPHIECIQRFGSIVQDYQNEMSEFHKP
ncbi:TPA: hypothetical protein N0F65_012284 [Lagenidium giganteum]|uniref:B-block binding subunit of TFIIIC domain-containing protein n=1 Tax=Lagenidium giganteum TaxID=4803 RepID=A0AAV2ZER7_9STRA|nr:TPA: hypothetical protein N0F65_012284 [Lagenidium giganteum]